MGFGPRGSTELSVQQNTWVAGNTMSFAQGTQFIDAFVPDVAENATEANVARRTVAALTVDLIAVHVSANTFDGTVVIELRDDGAAIGTLTLTAGQTGVVTASLSNVVIAAGSLVNWSHGVGTSSAGSITYRAMAFRYRA